MQGEKQSDQRIFVSLLSVYRRNSLISPALEIRFLFATPAVPLSEC
jgi:hypothetical protein